MNNKDLTISNIESEIRSAAILYASAYAPYRERLPKIRFVSDIPFLLQIKYPSRRRQGWLNKSIIDVFGMDTVANLDHLQELMKNEVGTTWERMMISFQNDHSVTSSIDALISYHYKPRHVIAYPA